MREKNKAMLFKDIKQNYPVYILNKQDLSLTQGKAVLVPYFDTSKATSMDSMFSGCSRLRRIPLLNTSNVTNFNYTFKGAKSLTTLPAIDTSKATTTSGMFYGCTCLTELPN